MVRLSSSTNKRLPTLDELAHKYGTDKASGLHGYTEQYVRYLEPMRFQPLTVLELGWGGHEDPNKGGASAQMWRDYFPSGKVVCIDLEPKVTTESHDGITFVQGDQADRRFIDELARAHGPFDVVVDDASHLSSLTIQSWELLYRHLTPGGLYVVEDMHSSYHDFYYGDSEANPNPDLNGTQTVTAMNYFKRMADEVNFHGERPGREDWDLFPAKFWKGFSLEFVHFYFDILFVKKREDAARS